MADAARQPVARRRLRATGVVQGVGFRPFVVRLALRHRLAGWVLNDGGGVVIEAEGAPDALDAFTRALRDEAPPLARVSEVSREEVAPLDERDFTVRASAETGRSALIPPDVATCSDCLRELFDPTDRRFRHPFITCTDCGPRLTIVRAVPYDRANTTMAPFALCDACRSEYEDPLDRRYHAEPIACPDCGPRLSMPVDEAVALLRGGAVIAVKGLGGYHLACDAGNAAAVARLRERKARDDKPFALMTSHPDALVTLTPAERELLESPARPIVLAARRPDAPVADAVAPGAPELGVMLPYTPVHHLLCADLGRPLVMTSGNRSDEPIAFHDEEARERLRQIADAFLTHDRPIHRRCEDSVVRERHPIRRSRGYAPAPLPLPAANGLPPLLACGAELKSTFCVVREGQAFLSAHLGDLHTADAYVAFRADVALYCDMLGVRPQVIAHDLHPDYLATRWALERDAQLIGVQHHHAHAAACLAEHGRAGPALALVFDGTGLGDDGTLWGGELLRCDLAGYERVAHLEAIPLAGGERAVREPWRVAAAYLERAGLTPRWGRWGSVRAALALNAPLSSGMGRLFDAVSALLGVREEVSYEGQAAMELEHLAGDAAADPYPCRTDGGIIRGVDLVAAAYDDLTAGRPREQISAAFHEGVAAAAVRACAQAAQPHTVVLSGGSFQNRRLARAVREGLSRGGFEVLEHRRVPPNDGGISYGQAAVAAARLHQPSDGVT